MSKTLQERQKFIRYWMEKTGNTEIDMNAVAKMAIEMGWKVPSQMSDEDRMVKLFKTAARQDIRHDRKTGSPYRVYHAVPNRKPDGQLYFSYIDIDEPKTKPEHFRKACVLRREQTVDDLYQLRLDQLHWNDNRPEEQQVEILPADLEYDIELMRAVTDDIDEAG